MLHTRTVLAALLATAGACAGKQVADTAPSAPPTEEPASPAVDPAIFEANDKDIEELNGILAEFETVAKAAATGPTEVQTAVTALSDLGKEKNIKQKRIDTIVAGSLKSRKVKLRGVKKADREQMTAAVQALLDAVGGLETVSQTIADTRAEIAGHQARAGELTQAIRDRTQDVADGSDGDAKTKAQAQLDHVKKVLDAVDGNVASANGLLDDLDKNAKALADALGVEIKPAKTSDVPAAEAAAKTDGP